MNATPSPKLPRVEEMDGLRGILAAWVAVAHVVCWSGLASAALPRPFNRVWQSFVSAQSAVEIFIILSGFAISFLLRGSPPSLRTFLRGRFFRIYPTYAFCLGLGAATVWLVPGILQRAAWKDGVYLQWVAGISQHERQQFLEHSLSHLTLLNGLLPAALLPDASATLLPPAWSISLEWQYYLAAPLIASLLRSRFLWTILAAVIFLGLRFQDPWTNPNLAFLPAQLPLFLVGIGSYHLYARCAGRLAVWKPGWMPVMGLLLVGMALIAWRPVALGVWATVLGCVLAGERGPLTRPFAVARAVLRHAWLQRLGAISYPLYLVHWPIIVVSLSLLLRWRPAAQSTEAVTWLLFLAMPMMLLAAGFLHRAIEVPCMRFGKRAVQPMDVRYTKSRV